MSFSLKNIIATLALAIIGFFIGPMVFSPDNLGIAVSISIILGAVVIMALQSSNTEEGSEVEELNTTTLYVGNLPYKSNEEAIQDHFETIVKVNSVRLMKDKRTGKRKGYGFVEVESKGADKAIDKLNDKEFQQRNLVVRLAKEKVAH
jgi:RNA recognition motif-containing protein